MALFNRKGRLETPWLSISDLMTVLMFLFLLCFVVIINKQKILMEENNTAQERETIKNSLISGFSQTDLQHWGATINDKNGDVHITNIDFDSGKFDLKPRHKGLLDDFFPKYISILSLASNRITDIKIEGHTDSDGQYLMNLRLSQDRSREVLAYLIQENPQWETKNMWFFKKLSASGRSESRIIFTNRNGGSEYEQNKYNAEDKAQSRRVVFRFILQEADFGGTNIPIDRITVTNEITITNTVSNIMKFPKPENAEIENPAEEFTGIPSEESNLEKVSPKNISEPIDTPPAKKKGAKR